jgi:nitrite reductase/ring-hydroxylating ferredoxin subunit
LQGKDFGCIATDKGYNLYVGGNGGSKPRHAELLAADISEMLVIKYLDRFLMYYITTADKLTRTARWIEKLEGGIQYLKKVIVDDYLGIGEELEAQMQQLINAYECEWTKVVKDPKARDHFKQFVNSNDTQPMIEIIKERDQARPASWPKEVPSINTSDNYVEERIWFLAGPVSAFPPDQGKTIRYGDVQVAVFHKASGEWYATQNICPHKRALVLSSGLLGSVDNEAGQESYVSCPMHKVNCQIQHISFSNVTLSKVPN